ncbi:hypothetical protein DFH09DRAFT_1097222 [Mycena vulgaris]|nr:hypothetical protein DFH09DRAFT_1097222 [Mycena vulgaris]
MALSTLRASNQSQVVGSLRRLLQERLARLPSRTAPDLLLIRPSVPQLRRSIARACTIHRHMGSVELSTFLQAVGVPGIAHVPGERDPNCSCWLPAQPRSDLGVARSRASYAHPIHSIAELHIDVIRQNQSLPHPSARFIYPWYWSTAGFKTELVKMLNSSKWSRNTEQARHTRISAYIKFKSDPGRCQSIKLSFN